MLFLATWFCFLCTVKSIVLDPALYLSPSPPLTPSEMDGQVLWSLPRMQRGANLAVIPIEQIKTVTTPLSPCSTNPISTSTELTTPTSNPTKSLTSETSTIKITRADEEMMENAETFWPGQRTTGPVFGIHVPLTFALTGNYGRYGMSGGVISSSYASISEDGDSGLFKLYGKGLAGSSYGTYSGGTRIYGKGGSASWSGWGNGKWGHYGKG